MNTNNKTELKGIFDSEPARPTIGHQEARPKEEFKDPFRQNAESIQSRAEVKKPKLEELLKESTLERTMGSVNGATPGIKDVQKEIDEMEKFSEEDLKLAEQMIFKGYAETEVSMPKFPGNMFSICSTSAEEVSMVEEIVFDALKAAEDDKGVVNLSQTKVTSLRNSLYIAISYRGMNRKEISDNTSCHLNTIKKAIIRISDLEASGELKESEELKISLKKRLIQRSVIINRLATPVIDFLSDVKYKFDSKMFKILTHEEIIPKS